MRKLQIQFDTTSFSVDQTIAIHPNVTLSDKEILKKLKSGDILTTINTGGFLIQLNNFQQLGIIEECSINHDEEYTDFALVKE